MHGSSSQLAHPDDQAAHNSSAADPDQRGQGGQEAGEGSSQPPAAGNEGTQAAMEPHKPHGVPDRIPAALALQPSKDTAAAAAAEHSSVTNHQSASVGAAAGVAHELKPPQVVQQQKQQEGRSSPSPVFVPIVVAMDAQDHKVMVEEWYSRHMVSIYS